MSPKAALGCSVLLPTVCDLGFCLSPRERRAEGGGESSHIDDFCPRRADSEEKAILNAGLNNFLLEPRDTVESRPSLDITASHFFMPEKWEAAQDPESERQFLSEKREANHAPRNGAIRIQKMGDGSAESSRHPALVRPAAL